MAYATNDESYAGTTQDEAEDFSDDSSSTSQSTESSSDDGEASVAERSASSVTEPIGLPRLPQTRFSGKDSPTRAEPKLSQIGKGWKSFKKILKKDAERSTLSPAQGPNESQSWSTSSVTESHRASYGASEDASKGKGSVSYCDEDGDNEGEPNQPDIGAASLNNRLPTHITNKLYQDLSDVRLVQDIEAHHGVIWAAAFDLSGRHLATGGQDGYVRLWSVLINRQYHSQEEVVPGKPLAAPLLESEPVWEWSDHKQEVLCLAWSSAGFLASGGMDGTVRLWHPSRADCLRTFQHSDWVVAVEWHPRLHRLLSACVDGKARVWAIPEQRVLDYTDVHEMVTAAAWVPPDGARVAVATRNGKVRFYGADEHGHLDYEAQVDVKNRHTIASKSRKVTGLAFQSTSEVCGIVRSISDDGAPVSSSDSDREAVRGKVSSSLLLVTSSDSRVRVFDGYGIICKLKGPCLGDSQIYARWAPDGRHITCGSETGWAFLWDAGADTSPGDGPKEKVAAWEAFYVGPSGVTVVLTAPLSCQRSKAALEQAAQAYDTCAVTGESQAMRASRQLLALRPSAAAKSAATAAVDAARILGKVFVAVTECGKISVAENVGQPRWL